MPVKRHGYGVHEKMPVEATFSDVTFTFISDGYGVNWNFFQQWMNMIFNYDMRNGIDGSSQTAQSFSGRQQPYEIAYKSDYITDVEIIVFNASGSDVFTIVLRDAYPVALNPIQLNWGDTNDIMRIGISFTFTDWYRKLPDRIYSKEAPQTPQQLPDNKSVTGIPFN
jgi:hypothetical protein